MSTVGPAIVQLSVDAAYVCAEPECKTISNDSDKCPRCHSQVISLALVLNRDTEPGEHEGK